jgi:ATP-dependent DNA ligase
LGDAPLAVVRSSGPRRTVAVGIAADGPPAAADVPSSAVSLGCSQRGRRFCPGALEDFGQRASIAGKLIVTPCTRDLALATSWLEDFDRDGRDGVIAKRLDAPYLGGERAMLKIKRLRTADCVVGGFRYQSRAGEVGSLLLGLYNPEGLLDHVGFTSTIPNDERPALTRKLRALRAPPGFTGAAPGGPSRWSTERSGEWEPLRPELVVEVRYDHVTGGRFRHGTKLLRWRPDKPPRQCTMEQVAAPPRVL